MLAYKWLKVTSAVSHTSTGTYSKMSFHLEKRSTGCHQTFWCSHCPSTSGSGLGPIQYVTFWEDIGYMPLLVQWRLLSVHQRDDNFGTS